MVHMYNKSWYICTTSHGTYVQQVIVFFGTLPGVCISQLNRKNPKHTPGTSKKAPQLADVLSLRNIFMDDVETEVKF